MKAALTMLVLGALLIVACSQQQPGVPEGPAVTGNVPNEGINTGADGAGELSRDCPDEWIINRMPATCQNLEECGPEEYFVVGGERRETSEYDVAWIRSNCDLVPDVVY